MNEIGEYGVSLGRNIDMGGELWYIDFPIKLLLLTRVTNIHSVVSKAQALCV